MTFAEISNLVGKCNASEFLGKPAGHLLVSTIEVNHKSHQRLITDDDVKDIPRTIVIQLIHDPEAPWNHVKDKDGMRHPVFSPTGKPLYEAVEFPPVSEEVSYQIRKR